jgi:hypothetical protein
MPFYLWKDEVGKVVIRADAYPSSDWFEKTQLARLARMYDSGETIECGKLADTWVCGEPCEPRPEGSPLTLDQVAAIAADESHDIDDDGMCPHGRRATQDCIRCEDLAEQAANDAREDGTLRDGTRGFRGGKP